MITREKDIDDTRLSDPIARFSLQFTIKNQLFPFIPRETEKRETQTVYPFVYVLSRPNRFIQIGKLATLCYTAVLYGTSHLGQDLFKSLRSIQSGAGSSYSSAHTDLINLRDCMF